MRPRSMSVTIASDGTISTLVVLHDSTTVGFITPAALTSTVFTFVVCDTATGTFVPLYDSAGNQASVTVTTDRAYTLTSGEADAIAPWPYMKLVGNSAEGAARTIVVQKK